MLQNGNDAELFLNGFFLIERIFKMECWQLGSIDNALAVDKKACKKIFGKLTALTKLIHNIEGIIMELHIISYASEKRKNTLRRGK